MAPVASACIGAASLGYLAWSPDTADGIPCPLHAATGWWCPACGATRGMRALLDGDVAAALGHNLLLPVIMATVVAVWWAWTRHALGRAPRAWTRRIADLPPGVWVALGGAVLVFTVVRNTSAGAALAP